MRWKKLLWFLGGAAAGTTLYSVTRRQVKASNAPVDSIPRDLQGLQIRTELEEIRVLKQGFRSYFEFRCEPTSFVYISAMGSSGTEEGIPIYHVSPLWHLQAAGGAENQVAQGKFYATVWSQVPEGRSLVWRPSCLQRGSFCEFRLCRVGGSATGVSAGERIHPTTPVADYTFLR